MTSSSNNPSPFHNSANNGNFPSAATNSYQSLPCLSKPANSASLMREGVEQQQNGTFYKYFMHYIKSMNKLIVIFTLCLLVYSIFHFTVKRGNWNPFEDSQNFGQLSEDALFDAEFDRIRESPSNVVPTGHSLPYPTTQSSTFQPTQPPNVTTGSIQQQMGNLNLGKSDNNRAHRQAPPAPFATSRPRADPFQSAPFPLAPKNN